MAVSTRHKIKDYWKRAMNNLDRCIEDMRMADELGKSRTDLNGVMIPKAIESTLAIKELLESVGEQL